MPKIAVINSFGKVESSTTTWPELDYTVPLCRWSVQEHAYQPSYNGYGFTMSLGSAKATVSKTNSEGIYFVEILGDKLVDAYHLYQFIQSKLGYEVVTVFPTIVVENTGFWARLRWLLTGKID